MINCILATVKNYQVINIQFIFCSTDTMPRNISLALNQIKHMNLMPVYGKLLSC